MTDFKHLVYNLLVEQHNNPNNPHNLVEPCSLVLNGTQRFGFRFVASRNPEKRLVTNNDEKFFFLLFLKTQFSMVFFKIFNHFF